MKVAEKAAESALIAVAVLTATGLRVGMPESVHATSQPIEKPHPAYVMVEMAVEVMAITAASLWQPAGSWREEGPENRGMSEMSRTQLVADPAEAG